jgi:hypothetical protein
LYAQYYLGAVFEDFLYVCIFWGGVGCARMWLRYLEEALSITEGGDMSLEDLLHGTLSGQLLLNQLSHDSQPKRKKRDTGQMNSSHNITPASALT